MHAYWQRMQPLGRPLTPARLTAGRANEATIRQVEEELDRARRQAASAGTPLEKLHQRGQLGVFERIGGLVEPGSWLELGSLFNPAGNPQATTGLVTGLGRVSGRWVAVAAFDQSVLAGALMPGQAEKGLRIAGVAQMLNLPLVWLMNCSGVKLDEQEKIFAGRSGSGALFYEHAAMALAGRPVLAGLYGANPAGGGYLSASTHHLAAHAQASMAVGGAGIMGGMSPAGKFDLAAAAQIIEAAEASQGQAPPGGPATHFTGTGFMRSVHETEQGVLDELKKQVAALPAYAPGFFRVDEPRPPAFATEDLYTLLPARPGRAYSIEAVLARLVDGGEHLEYRPGFGPEVYCGLAKAQGLPLAVAANRQGFLPRGYPGYARGAYQGVGGKLYRDGLLKLAEFTSLAGRDRLPMVWVQDCAGIDVGQPAEEAELLGLGQALAFSVEQSGLPMLLIVLRNGGTAAHYVMGGPQARRDNVFTLATPLSRINVMHGPTAAVAMYARRLARQKAQGRDLAPVLDEMNALVAGYETCGSPLYAATHGLADEAAPLDRLRRYLAAFAQAAFQNPRSFCPAHLALLPRLCAKMES